MSDEKLKNQPSTTDPAQASPQPEMQRSVSDFLADKNKLMEEAAKQQKAMEDQFKRLVTVMFTDIKGSTSFYETHGDIEGRMMVEQHNNLLFPIVEEFNGVIIKTVGDAIMAKYPDPTQGVRAGIKMQHALREYREKPTAYDIHVRIGIHFGYGMVENDDIFGDVVNCAARIESLADGDEINISGDVYEQVREADDIIVRFKEETKVKGRNEPVTVYRVIWNEKDLIIEEAELTKTGTRRVSKRLREMVEIHINRVGDTIKISATEKIKGQQKTVNHYEESNVSSEEVGKLCQQVTGLLNRANKRGKISKEILKQLKEVGATLYDKILTGETKQLLQKTEADELMIHIDDQLVQVPWELMFDGHEFLGLRFSLGRIVSTKQKVTESKSRRIGHPLRMLVLADPRNDLPSSTEEGRELRTKLDAFSRDINVHLKTGAISREFIEQKIRNFDIVHYAGHADYNPDNPSASGWLVQDGRVTAQDITKMGGGKPMPSLVFSNACQSGQTEEWSINENFEQEIYGLANAFLLSGVQHYVGTFWDILDAPSLHFSSALYQSLMEGESIGTAVKSARIALLQRYGEENIVWASYMLYGDPSFVYHQSGAQVIDIPEALEPSEMKQAVGAEMPSGALRHADAGILGHSGSLTSSGKMTNILIGIGLALVVVLAGMLFFKNQTAKMGDDNSIAAQGYGFVQAGEYDKAHAEFSALAGDNDTSVKGHEGLAALAFAQGDYQTAQNEAQLALKEDPQNIYARVVLGNVAFNQNELNKAENLYRQATDATSGETWQKSEAFNRLGRVYAAKGDNGQALASYGQAVQLDPSNSEAFTNQGKAYEKNGDMENAVASYKQGASDGSDVVANRLLANALASQNVHGNKERMTAIRKQVSDLSERYQQGKASAGAEAAAVAEDDWTSPPMDITFIDFENGGAASLREGEDEYLLLKVIDGLQATGRVQVVEREMIDELLAELDLSSSDLADKRTAQKLGKLIGARMISTGSLTRHRSEVQVSLRMIETETSKIPIAITQTFDANDKLDKIAEKITGEIVSKIKASFPLQAKIVGVEGNTVTLNIGSLQGMTVGSELDLIDDSEVITSGGVELGRKKAKVGKVKVTQVEEGYSLAEVSTGKADKNLKVAEAN